MNPQVYESWRQKHGEEDITGGNGQSDTQDKACDRSHDQEQEHVIPSDPG